MSETREIATFRYGRQLIPTTMAEDETCYLVQLTGDQIEILSNLLNYAHVRSSWNDETICAIRYYMPDDDAWDTLQAVVDDLEYRLMSKCQYVTLDDVNERVGIKETEPGATLDVAGGVNIQTGGTFAAAGKHIEIYMPSLDDYGRINAIDRTDGTALQLRFYAAGGFQFSAGNVGIGKAPSYPLDVNGAARVSGAFGCNGKGPQSARTIPNGPDDLSSVLSLCEAIAQALIDMGICVR